MLGLSTRMSSQTKLSKIVVLPEIKEGRRREGIEIAKL